jgi:hypothetical protein
MEYLEYIKYLFYCLPIVFILLSRWYMIKFKKLRDSGKIPRIVGARQRQKLFLYLAILSVLVILIVQFQFY